MTTFAKHTRTRIVTWNVRALNTPGGLAQGAAEFSNYNLKVLGLCEVRWTDGGVHRLLSGQTQLYSFRPPLQGIGSGVGLLLTPKARRWPYGVLNSDKILPAGFRTKSRNVSFDFVYAPTNDADEKVNQTLNNLLSETMTKAGWHQDCNGYRQHKSR